MTGQQLKNSILQMAVQGKLVPQDPNDEPASVLLERIRIEKEQLIKEGKIKKDKNPSYIFRGDDNLPYEKVGENEPICIADEVPFEIPESWEWVRFSSVIELQSGQDMTPDKYNSVQKGIPYLTGASNIENGKIIINRWTESGKAFAYKGDLLITCKGTVGTMTILEEDMVHIARQIMAIKSNHSIGIEYIKLVLETLVATLKAAAKSMIPGISRDDILMSFLPLPPHKEQIRIVDFYKSMIPFIDEYTEKELMLQDLNQSFTELLKKSILQEAVHGKLVPQDPNDEPASVLLERIRAEKEALIKAGKIKRDKNESVIFRRDNSHYEKHGSEEICIDDDIPFDCPQSWAWCRMGDLISVRGGKRLPAGAQLTTEKTDHVYIRVTDMKNGTVDLSDLHYISDDIYDSIKNYIIRSEDVYIVIVGSTIGKAGIVPYELDGMNLTENAARLTPILVNRDYLLLAIQTDLLQKQFIDRTNQVGQPKLALERLKTALIPLPPLNEQQRIIETYRTLVPIIQNA